MKKKSKNKVFVQATEQITLDELAERISHTVDHDDVAYFIARLEQMYESMEVTEAVINHFDAVKDAIVKSIPSDEKIEDTIELKPKLLTDRA